MLSVETGTFGFVDMYNTKAMGTKKLVCELTLKDGKVVYDLNGISADMWDATQHSADEKQSRRWTTFNERPFGATHGQKFPTPCRWARSTSSRPSRKRSIAHASRRQRSKRFSRPDSASHCSPAASFYRRRL